MQRERVEVDPQRVRDPGKIGKSDRRTQTRQCLAIVAYIWNFIALIGAWWALALLEIGWTNAILNFGSP